MSDQPGHDALRELDKALAAKPRRDGEAFSATTKSLCGMREKVIARVDRDPSPEHRNALNHLNAIISVVLGGHYPLGQVPWDELQKARSWLEDIVRTEEPA